MNPALLMYCALSCQVVEYAERFTNIMNEVRCYDVYNQKHAMAIEHDLLRPGNAFAGEAWTIVVYSANSKCKKIDAKNQARILSYFIDFDGDGGYCFR